MIGNIAEVSEDKWNNAESPETIEYIDACIVVKTWVVASAFLLGQVCPYPMISVRTQILRDESMMVADGVLYIADFVGTCKRDSGLTFVPADVTGGDHFDLTKVGPLAKDRSCEDRMRLCTVSVVRVEPATSEVSDIRSRPLPLRACVVIAGFLKDSFPSLEEPGSVKLRGGCESWKLESRYARECCQMCHSTLLIIVLNKSSLARVDLRRLISAVEASAWPQYLHSELYSNAEVFLKSGSIDSALLRLSTGSSLISTPGPITLLLLDNGKT